MPSPTLPDDKGDKGCAPPFGTALSPSGSSRKGVSPASPLQSTGATIADVLNRAAVRLSKPGEWGSCGHPMASGNHCAATAIMADGNGGGDAAQKFFASFLGLTTEKHSRFAIYAWNDTPGRTQAEVVAKLREAAAKALEQGK